MKELIADLVWDDERHAVRPDEFGGIDSSVDGFGLGNEFERLLARGYELGHDRFCQRSLRFQMLRTRD